MAIACVVGLGLLVADNVYWLVRNEIELTCASKVCLSPRSIEAIARRSAHPQIGALSNWYFLNQSIPHARLTVPPTMGRHRWHLEYLARLHVEVGDRPFIVDPRHIPDLQRTSTDHRKLRWWRRKAVTSDLYMHFDRSNDYVLAEASGGAGPVFLMPRSRYAAVAAR